MQLDQLRNFLAVAKSGNISHAAAELRVSQPNVSRSLSSLEQELGVQLFDRNPRSLPLTEAGKTLQKHARQILDMVDATKALITDDGKTGVVRIGAIPTIAPYFLPGFLQLFAREFPDATIQLSEEVTPKLIERVTHGEIDVAMMALPIHTKYLDISPLIKEELFLIASPKHPVCDQLKTREQLELSTLSEFPFIMLDQEHCLSEQIISFCQKKSFQPIMMERVSQLATIQALVSLGHGISLMPEMAKMKDHDQDRIYIRVKNPQPVRTIAMVSNSYRYQTRLLKSTLKLLKKYSEKWRS